LGSRLTVGKATNLRIISMLTGDAGCSAFIITAG
jgi:hypothetical protein